MSTQPAPAVEQETRPLAVYTDADDMDLAPGIAALEAAGFRVEVLNTTDTQAIIDGARGATALLVGYAEIPARVFEELPQLRMLALLSMGFDNVDLEAAKRHGVWVSNVPGAATEEVATHTLALLLHQFRQLDYFAANAKREDTWFDRGTASPLRLSELTLGVVGLGKIGLRFAQLARPLFGSIVGYDPFLPQDQATRERLDDLGIRRGSLEEVRDAANVLSLHVPLTPDTERMVDAAFLAAMPRGAVILNVSRGALLDEAAVAAALDDGQLAGAGLDVLTEEPPAPGHPLLGRGDVIVTPHVAYLSQTTDREYVRIQAGNVVAWARDGRPENWVSAPEDAPAL